MEETAENAWFPARSLRLFIVTSTLRRQAGVCILLHVVAADVPRRATGAEAGINLESTKKRTDE